MRSAAVVALAVVTLIATAFAIWPVVADAPWEGNDKLEIRPTGTDTSTPAGQASPEEVCALLPLPRPIPDENITVRFSGGLSDDGLRYECEWIYEVPSSDTPVRYEGGADAYDILSANWVTDAAVCGSHVCTWHPLPGQVSLLYFDSAAQELVTATGFLGDQPYRWRHTYVESIAPLSSREVETPLPDRRSCAEVRGTEYRSAAEGDWFLRNCLVPTPIPTEPLSALPPPTLVPLPPARAPDAGALVAADGQYLGIVTCNRYEPDGIFNRFGTYGSRFSSTSIWNRFGQYGGRFGPYSPFNRFGEPPLIDDTTHLTVSSVHVPRITPLELVLGCFADDSSTAEYWLGLIEERS